MLTNVSKHFTLRKKLRKSHQREYSYNINTTSKGRHGYSIIISKLQKRKVIMRNWYLYMNRMDLTEDREENQEVNKIESTSHHC